jgi:hypothetical protein
MSGDPRNRRETIERDAALANGNQRLTRILNLLTLQLQAGLPPGDGPVLDEFARQGGAALEALAVAAGGLAGSAGPTSPELRERLDRIRPPAAPPPGDEAGRQRAWIYAQVGRAATELSAMLLA